MDHNGIQVFLISGFLGAGKTTLLNRMLKEVPKDIKLIVLVNEFGEEGIDGTLVADPQLELLEINKGSIFCACVKGDYLKALYRIAFVLKPCLLVIEASGAANPADMRRDLFNPLFKNSFASLTTVCLLDAENYLGHSSVFTAVEKQVESSDILVINKTDLADPSQMEAIKTSVGVLNPEASLIETSYAKLDLTWLVNALPERHRPSAGNELAANLVMAEDELDEIVDDILQDEAAQVTPPDLLTSATFHWNEGTLKDFQYIAEHIPGDVVRAKGFLFHAGRWFLYNHVGRRYEITPMNDMRNSEQSVNRIVLVRQLTDYDDIRSLFLSRNIPVFVP